MDYFDHLELRAGLDVLWVTRSVAVPDHVRKLRVRPGDPRMHRILSLRQDPVALRRFCARSLSHLQVGRLTDAQLESAVESELESGRLCALVLTLGDAHTAQAQVESASRVPLPPMKPMVAANPAAQPKAAPGAMGAIKPVVATKVLAPNLATPVPGPGTQRPAAATAVAQPHLPKDPDEALGERFSEVVSRAGKRAPDEIKQVLLELTSPASIRMMVYIAAGLGVAMLAGVGEIAIAGLLAWAYFEGGKAAVLGVTDLVTFMMLTYNAKTDKDLDDAADALISAAKALVTVGMVVLMHRMAARKVGPNKPKPVEKRSAPRNPEVRRPLPVEEEAAAKPKPEESTKKASAAKGPRTLAECEKLVAEGDFSTPKDGSVFYGGRGAKAKAQALGEKPGFSTIEQTKAGNMLDKEALFSSDHPLYDKRFEVWDKASEKFASSAKGDVTAIVKDASERGTFYRRELPALLENPEVTNINGIDASKLRTLPFDDAFKAIQGASP